MSEQHVDDVLEKLKSLKSKFEDLTLHNETMKSSILELLTEIKERDKEIMNKINTLELEQNEIQEYNYNVKEFTKNQVKINKTNNTKILEHKNSLNKYITKDEALIEKTLILSKIESRDIQEQLDTFILDINKKILNLTNRINVHNELHYSSIKEAQKLRLVLQMLISILILILLINMLYYTKNLAIDILKI